MSLIRNAFSRLHYPVDVIAQYIRWYLVYSLSLRNREDMMAERGIVVDHSTLHRWVRIVLSVDRLKNRQCNFCWLFYANVTEPKIKRDTRWGNKKG
jgi:putative transposase